MESNNSTKYYEETKNIYATRIYILSIMLLIVSLTLLIQSIKLCIDKYRRDKRKSIKLLKRGREIYASDNPSAIMFKV